MNPAHDIPSPALEVRQLSYRYPGGKRALDGVTFSIGPRERVALVGPSGAGKSTLLLHLPGVLLSATGNGSGVYVNGIPVLPAQLRRIRQSVGLLFQEADDQLFCPTVADDVAFGPINAGKSAGEVAELVDQSLQLVGMAHAAGESPRQLSAGERRRVCLAGLFACQPAILALDEPTAGLDPRSRRQVLEILQRFPGLVLVATHDLDFVIDLCTRVLVLDGGRLQGDGPITRILTDPVLMDRHGLEVPWRLRERDRQT